MFEIDSTTSWSRYRAALNAAQSKLVLTQDRDDIAVRVRPARENVDGEKTVVTMFEAADVNCVVSVDFFGYCRRLRFDYRVNRKDRASAWGATC